MIVDLKVLRVLTVHGPEPWQSNVVCCVLADPELDLVALFKDFMARFANPAILPPFNSDAGIDSEEFYAAQEEMDRNGWHGEDYHQRFTSMLVKEHGCAVVPFKDDYFQYTFSDLPFGYGEQD